MTDRQVDKSQINTKSTIPWNKRCRGRKTAGLSSVYSCYIMRTGRTGAPKNNANSHESRSSYLTRTRIMKVQKPVLSWTRHRERLKHWWTSPQTNHHMEIKTKRQKDLPILGNSCQSKVACHDKPRAPGKSACSRRTCNVDQKKRKIRNHIISCTNLLWNS